jgi:excisionase family DNA binding protein
VSAPAAEAPAVGAEHLLTADELAERWQVPKAQVYRLTRDGRMPTVRIGRYYRYRLAAVEEWELEGGDSE